jgi:hypothetical protein
MTHMGVLKCQITSKILRGNQKPQMGKRTTIDKNVRKVYTENYKLNNTNLTKNGVNASVPECK